MCANAPARRVDDMTSTPPGTAVSDANAHHVARVELPPAASLSARSAIRRLTCLARTLPARIEVVIVSVPSVEALTFELLAGIAVGRRLMSARGRHLLVRVPGRPHTPAVDALLLTMPFVVVAGPSG